MVGKLATIFVLFGGLVLISPGQSGDVQPGTWKRPIIDSRMSTRQVFDGIDPACPQEILKRQRIVKVKYYSFDGRVHEGQIVIDRDLTRDIKEIFKLAFSENFPIYSVIPISHPQFRRNGRWDDDLSMAANNTSGFNYREKTGDGSLSNHAFGRAIDINTVQNPYLKNGLVLPPNGKYDSQARGTLTSDSPIVKKFRELGWTWGGDWESFKDYQHFEKPIATVHSTK